jgi:hypothetical protein
VLTFQE